MAKLCGDCGIKLGMLTGLQVDGAIYCKECAPKIETDVKRRKELMKQGVSHIFTVTIENGLKGSFQKLIGPVSARAIVKLDILQDFFVNIMDNFGGRSGALQRYFKQAEKTALQELKLETALAGGKGVIGLRVNYDLMEMKEGKMILVNMIGTAVA
jgi:uncharacterized protein YbjQ (UPF0145 family)